MRHNAQSHRRETTDQLGRGMLAAVAAALAIALLAAGCNRSSDSAQNNNGGPGTRTTPTVVPVDEGTPKDGGKMLIGIDAEPDGFDTTANQFAQQSFFISSSMLEALTVFDADQNPKPYLAESI